MHKEAAQRILDVCREEMKKIDARLRGEPVWDIVMEPFRNVEDILVYITEGNSIDNELQAYRRMLSRPEIDNNLHIDDNTNTNENAMHKQSADLKPGDMVFVERTRGPAVFGTFIQYHIERFGEKYAGVKIIRGQRRHPKNIVQRATPELYRKYHEECPIKEGDRVLVTHETNPPGWMEDLGPDEYRWPLYKIREIIGKTCIVARKDISERGYFVSAGWIVPFTSLKKMK
jgi:hypothetical protein